MFCESNLTYFRRREAVERAAAEASVNVVVRHVHLAMAERYADQAWSLEEAQLATARLKARAKE